MTVRARILVVAAAVAVVAAVGFLLGAGTDYR